MALATVRPSFSFHAPSTLPPPKTSKTHPPIALPISKTPAFNSPFQSLHKPQIHHQFSTSSVDVSKEDKPFADDPPVPEDPLAAEEEGEKFGRRRVEEQFAVLNTGIYECRSCGYLYDEAAGDPLYPIPPGFQYSKLPEDWRCPTCGAAKSFFVSKRMEIAGFAQNQSFGLGTNALTGGQKALLIYGSLLLGFALFLSGYFLQ